MMLALLLAVLPTLSPENYPQVKQDAQQTTVVVLFTMDGCAPCEVMKQRLDGIRNVYTVHNTSPVFAMTKGTIRFFPSIAVWRGDQLTIYQGTSVIDRRFPRIPRPFRR